MSVVATLRAWYQRFFRRAELERELGDELSSHVQLRADDLERSGLVRAEAERRARIELGGELRTREEIHDAIGGTFLDTLGQDIRYGWRVLWRTPAFTLVAVLTLALCIGANSVVFGALDALVLRPLDVPRAQSLFSVHRVKGSSSYQSYPDYLDYRDRNRSMEDLAAYGIVRAGFDSGDTPLPSWGYIASGNFFDVMGVRPYRGRFFHASDERGPGSAPLVVLSFACWHRQFHDDPGVVGRTVRLNAGRYTVIGVAGPGFNGPLLMGAPDFFVPLVEQPQLDGENRLETRSNRWLFMVLGHLKAGVTREQAAADFTALSAAFERAHPKDVAKATYVLWRPNLYGEFLGGPVRGFLSALMLLAGLILVAACVNLGGLFAARSADRAREIAVRLALGAGRGRILRQLVTEALLISFLGGVLGLVGSVALLRALLDWNPFPQFPLRIPVTPDASIVVLALLMSIATGFAFGAIPVRQVFRTEPYEVIKTGGLSGVLQRTRLRDLLLVAQIAICALLVTSSFVAVRGLARSLHGDFGFEPRGTLIAQTGLGMAGYHGDAVLPMQKRLLESLASLPGVTAVASTDWAPLTTGDANGERIYKESETDLRPGGGTPVLVMKVSPGYLAAARTHLVAGRDLDWHDDTTATRVALVNRTFAREQFGSEASALGRSFRRRDASLVQVVGIVEDGKYENLSEAPQPTMFLPLAQAGTGEMDILVRGTGDPQALAEAVRVRMRTVDPALPCFLQSYDSALNLALFPARVAGVALGILGVIAAVLSITGIFGLAAYAVSRRMREFGIRIALGAEPRDVLRAALARPFRLLGYGSLAGVVLGLLASRVLGSIVYQANPRDPVVLAGAVLVMFLLGLLATWIPAKRALSVNPLVLLREE
ncbi:MAG TPA: ABC transporter permease [Candidatus Eisenbacteria bacterium]